MDFGALKAHARYMGPLCERMSVPTELSRVVDALPGFVWTTLPDGYCDFVNQRWCDYTGLRAADAYGQGWQAVIHPDDLLPLSTILMSGEPYEVEARMRRVDGEYRWFLFRVRPVLDTSGAIVKWCGVNTDIEDRKHSEEGLRRAEAILAGEKQFLEMVASGHSMPALLEALCRLVEATEPGCYCSVVLVDAGGTRLEHGAAPSLPTSFIDAIIGRPLNSDSGPCAMASYLNEQVIASDLTVETRWAAYAWCPMALAHGLQACWSFPIPSTRGTVLGAFALYYNEPRTASGLHQSLMEQFTHIASIAIERAQGDAALKRSEALLTEAQHLSATGSFSWRVATDHVVYSEQTYRTYEFDPGEPVTLAMIATRIHPDDLTLLARMVDQARGPGTDLDYEYRLQMPDRSIRYMHLVGHSTRDQNGELEYIGAVQDVTHRRLSEEALATARSELARVARVTSLSALTASIAHEVNQPLSGIITNAGTCLRMLAADPPNVDGARETARRTIRDGNRASDVIARLRALFVKQDPTAELVDLNEVTREVIALSSSELLTSRVMLRPELADDLPMVTGDRVQLQQVILNLLRNASDATSGVDDRPRQVIIRSGRDGDGVRLTTQDAGTGFEPHGLDRLFEPFYTTKRGGMGIGLSVSRSIIESHHGRLWAAPNDGPGATFSFTVPGQFANIARASGAGAAQIPAPTDAANAVRKS